MGIKIFECKICKGFYQNGVKGEERFLGTRQEIREHLVKVHNMKGRKNKNNLKKKDFGQSQISQNTILYKEY